MAHVMNYKEILRAAENNTVVWAEFYNDDKLYPMCYNGTEFRDLSGDRCFLLMECEDSFPAYNHEYRLWNNMPTEREKKLTEWRINPYE